jgi:hypothetical protein
LHNQGATEIITRLAYLARIKKKKILGFQAKKLTKRKLNCVKVTYWLTDKQAKWLIL